MLAIPKGKYQNLALTYPRATDCNEYASLAAGRPKFQTGRPAAKESIAMESRVSAGWTDDIALRAAFESEKAISGDHPTERRPKTYQVTKPVAGTSGTPYTMTYNNAGNITNKTDIGDFTYGAGTAGPHAVTSVEDNNIISTKDQEDSRHLALEKQLDQLPWNAANPKQDHNANKTETPNRVETPVTKETNEEISDNF